MPNRFQNVNSGASLPAIVNQMNKNFASLDRETVVKQFKGNSGETLTIGTTGADTLGMSVTSGNNLAMQIGKYNSNRYGLLFYDVSGIPITLIGQSPDDGRMGIWQVRPGQNVIIKLGG